MSPRSVALVTGASAGLGEQFAQLFARDGHDVVLVARNAARMEPIAERLRLHKINPIVLSEDLSKPGAAARVHAAVKARGLEVNYLVNNAGFGSSGAFLDLPLEKEAEMVQLNCSTLLELCHLFGHDMRARKTGRILNIASTAGFQPGPFMATYYATKAFVVSFSEALSHELKDSGVTVTCHCPGATATEFAGRAGNDSSRLFQRPGVAKAQDVAAHAYEAMMQGEVLSVHGLLNWVSMQSLRLSPRAVVRSITAALNTKPE
ncbi:MAG: SDR family oxidoreductase [Archangium sp.]|nr:SDR family oxidoreductase [Archangium sp.]MDP3572585.1 SDR family oxidoreductase [Archangium sp.]